MQRTKRKKKTMKKMIRRGSQIKEERKRSYDFIIMHNMYEMFTYNTYVYVYCELISM